MPCEFGVYRQSCDFVSIAHDHGRRLCSKTSHRCLMYQSHMCSMILNSCHVRLMLMSLSTSITQDPLSNQYSYGPGRSSTSAGYISLSLSLVFDLELERSQSRTSGKLGCNSSTEQHVTLDIVNSIPDSILGGLRWVNMLSCLRSLFRPERRFAV